MLTCSHVVEGLCDVELREKPSEAKLCDARVFLQGDPNGTYDLALLELPSPLHDRLYLQFKPSKPEDTFRSLGFPADRKQAYGTIGLQADCRDWLEIDPRGSSKVTPGFSGAAVWVESRQTVVGLITHYWPDDVAYAITSAQINAFLAPVTPLAAEQRRRCRGFLRRTQRVLKSSELRQAIVESANVDAWAGVATKAEVFAELLCLKTRPEDLANGLSRAFVVLDEEGRHEEADGVFLVLLETMPAALLSQWQLELPGAEDPRVRLQVAGRVLAELAMAVAENGEASFHNRPDSKNSDEPRARHRLPMPGELGPDPGGEDAATELARDAQRRLALECPDASLELQSYLARTATQRWIDSEARLLDAADLQEMADTAKGELLRLMDELLARPTLVGQRRFYLVAGPGEEELVADIARLLPNLKVVSLDATDEERRLARSLLHPIKTVFHRRSRRAS